MTDSPDLRMTMTRIAERLGVAIPFSSFALYQYNADTETHRCVFATGVEAELFEGFLLEGLGGVVRQMQSGQRTAISSRPRFRHRAIGYPRLSTALHSMLMSAIVVRGRYLGAVSLYHVKRSAFRNEHAHQLESLLRGMGPLIEQLFTSPVETIHSDMPPPAPNGGDNTNADELADVPAVASLHSLSHYMVAFIDLLGQSDVLLAIDSIPHDREAQERILTSIAQTAGSVALVRSHLDTIVARISQANLTVGPVDGERRDIVSAIFAFDIRHRGMSDAFVVSVNLANRSTTQGFAAAATAVYCTLISLSTVYIYSLSHEIPFRGGVDVGLGIDLFPDEVYGPALVNAYHLESRSAEYPRIVAGRNLVEYLRSLQNLTYNDVFSAVARDFATRSLELLCSAPDAGCVMLNVLSPTITNLFAHRDELTKARQWVAAQVAKYLDERNDKLHTRYVRLAAYFVKFHTGA